MNRYLVSAALITALGVLVSCQCSGAGAPAKWPKYTITIVEQGLGQVYNMYVITPVALNNKGCALLQRSDEAYVCENGKLQNIGDLGIRAAELAHSLPMNTQLNGPLTMANAINDKRQVVGRSVTDKGMAHAFLWENGKMTDLGTLGGKSSTAYAINNRGQVVGSADNAVGGANAFIWDKVHGMKDLGIKGKSCRAIGISDKGLIIGTAYREFDFIWQNGKYSVLKNSPITRLQGINNKGDMVGIGAEGIYVQKKGEWKKIELDRFDASARVSCITDSGFVAGCGTSDYYVTDFIWRDGAVARLRELVPKESGWEFLGVVPTVNNKGQILTNATLKGQVHTILLTPQKQR